MNERFWISSVEYSTKGLSNEGQALVKQLKFLRLKLHELTNQHALMSKAKNAYIADLKSEIVQDRAGVDLGVLFSED
jgi:hypothetical protein